MKLRFKAESTEHVRFWRLARYDIRPGSMVESQHGNIVFGSMNLTGERAGDKQNPVIYSFEGWVDADQYPMLCKGIADGYITDMMYSMEANSFFFSISHDRAKPMLKIVRHWYD